MFFSNYKVIEISEGGCSTILLGSAKLPIIKIQNVLNEHAKEGWQVVFQVIESKRFLLFWSRDSMIVTLAKAE